MKTPINWANLKKHMTYNWWKYILAIVLAGFGVDMLFTITRYVVPDEKKVEIYAYGYMAEDPFNEYLKSIWEEETPEMESVSAMAIMPDDQYGDMVLQVRLMANEGDIYILPREQFMNTSDSGFMMDLESDTEIAAFLQEKGMSLQTGRRIVEGQTEPHLYGIPVSQLPGLQDYVATAEDGYVCIYVANGNDENVHRIFRRLLRDMAEEPAEITEKVE